MISFRSVKFRLTFAYALILSILLLAFTLFLYSEFANLLYREADESLRTEIHAFENSLEDDASEQFKLLEPLKLSKITLNSESYPPEIQEIIATALAIWEEKSRRISRSTYIVRFAGFDETVFLNNLKGWEKDIIFPDFRRDSKFMESGDAFQTIHFQKRPVRLYYHLVRFQTRPLFIMQIGRPIHDLQEVLNNLLFIILIAVPGAVLAACIAGFFLAKRALRPIDSMIKEAKSITAATLKGRLPRSHTGDELDRLAETLNEMIDRLEASTRAMQDFSSDISHELKTPLAIIRGEIDLALRKARSPESLKETLRTIEGEVNELIRLVDDLLLLVRSDAQQLKMDMKPLSLESVLWQSVERFQERALGKKIALTFVVPKDCMIQGDSLYLKRLFSNLVDNAIKFTSEDGHVVIELEHKPTHAIVRIADDGIGIEPEMQEKIFLRFFRTDQARSQEGAGLGLNIAKAICEAHRAKLRVDSTPGRGTTVSVQFPLH